MAKSIVFCPKTMSLQITNRVRANTKNEHENRFCKGRNISPLVWFFGKRGWNITINVNQIECQLMSITVN